MTKQLYTKTVLTAKELEFMQKNQSHWDNNAKKFTTSHEVSWGDINLVNMEINNIVNYVTDGNLVLDAGCSNGYSTFRINEKCDININAFDYSKKSLNSAIKQQSQKDPDRKIKFSTGNVLDISHENNIFDVVYTIRVLINLPNWNTQKMAIIELHRVLKKGQCYLMSEAFNGGLDNINSLRALANMEPLKTHDFNLYLNESELETFIQPYFEIIEIKNFSSIYYAASRFLRYLTLVEGEKDSFVNEINNMFAKIPITKNSGDFGIQKLYVLRKK